MATAKFYVPADALGGALFDAFDSAEVTSSSPSELRLGVPGGATLVILYGQFEYNAQGELIGGTLTGLTTYLSDGFSKEVVLSGMSVDLLTLVDVALYGTGNELGNLLFGGDDKFTGSSGADELATFNGNDTIDGGAGIDTMKGGDGSDTYAVRDVGDEVTETKASSSRGGIDTVNSYLGSYTLPTHVENGRIMSSGKADLAGNGLDNLLLAGAGNNTLSGGDGIDTVSYAQASAAVTIKLSVTTGQNTGGSGFDNLSGFENLTGSDHHDTLTGSSSANIVKGGDGNDLLNGGPNQDRLIGGEGDDVFRFDSKPDALSNIDTLTDYQGADDSIQLENQVFTQLANAGVLPAAHFAVNASGRAQDGNDFVVYESDTGKLFYDADGNGAGAAVQIALLANAPVLSHGDIFVT